MIEGMHIEPLLAATYALFLMAVAFALEMAARYSQRRSVRYEHSGFSYHRHMDLWECPAGQKLLRAEIDDNLRVVRYRAAPSTCNACPLKINCTDSDEGRMIERRLDDWIGRELRRFHRGISLTLLLLASVILAAAAVRYEQPRELALLASLLVIIGIIGSRMLAGFLHVHRDLRR